MAKYFLVREDQVYQQHGFIPVHQFTATQVHINAGNRMNIAGAIGGMTLLQLDSRALSEITRDIEIYWKNEYELLKQKTEEE